MNPEDFQSQWKKKIVLIFTSEDFVNFFDMISYLLFVFQVTPTCGYQPITNHHHVIDSHHSQAVQHPAACSLHSIMEPCQSPSGIEVDGKDIGHSGSGLSKRSN